MLGSGMVILGLPMVILGFPLILGISFLRRNRK